MTDTREPVEESFLIGGSEHRDIIMVEYDHTWPDRFTTERARIAEALGALAGAIEHIGSTAVPGLPAKAIVDILVTVSNIDDEPLYLPALTRAGYVLRVREPGHRMLRTPELDVHVHLWAEDDPDASALVAFRNKLRSSSADRELYAATKRRLAQQSWPTMNHYAAAKTDTIQRILSAGVPERAR